MNSKSKQIEQINIPSDFFSNALKEYQDWQFSWFREVLQNALDAGAKNVGFSIKKVNDTIELSVKDDGCGMTLQTLKQGFLTLGGTIKQTNKKSSDTTIGGYGYAKHIILFAHQQYEIETQNLIVAGKGIHYQIKEHADYYKGTKITVLLRQKTSINQLKDCCRLLIKQATNNIQIMLNEKVIRANTLSHDYEINTVLGNLQFSEIEEYSDIELWIRMKGLPMFRYYIENSGQKGLMASLDLTGKPTELLTTNRDGLTLKASETLDRLLHELVHQRQQFKKRNALNLVFNSETQISSFEKQSTDFLAAPVKQKFKSCQSISVLQKRVQEIITQLSQLPLIETYPENFHLYVTDMLFDRKRSNPYQITLSQIKYSLNLKRSQLIAWCWHFAVQWVLETDLLKSCFDIKYDEKKSCYISYANPKRPRTIQTGFVFDESSEGINIVDSEFIKILINPEFFQSDWLLADLLDVAIHECTHCLEPGHGDFFNDVEMNIRRDFRRLIIDEQEILIDSETIIDDLSALLQSA